MLGLLKNLFSATVTWAYYRVGWLRAAYMGIRIDWRARVNLHANLRGVVAIGAAEIGLDVSIGEGTYIGSGVIYSGRIGKYCSIGPDVLMGPTEHRLDHWTTSPYEAAAAGEPVGCTDKVLPAPILEDGVWIGARVIILRNVRIGARATIAAGAVVVTDVPPNELWGGVPARRLRRSGESNQIRGDR